MSKLQGLPSSATDAEDVRIDVRKGSRGVLHFVNNLEKDDQYKRYVLPGGACVVGSEREEDAGLTYFFLLSLSLVPCWQLANCGGYNPATIVATSLSSQEPLHCGCGTRSEVYHGV